MVFWGCSRDINAVNIYKYLWFFSAFFSESDRVIAMSFPSTGFMSFYRNPIKVWVLPCLSSHTGICHRLHTHVCSGSPPPLLFLPNNSVHIAQATFLLWWERGHQMHSWYLLPKFVSFLEIVSVNMVKRGTILGVVNEQTP